MLDERKSAILKAVVEGYIETAQPVGSAFVSRAPGLGVSSATVRNDMVLLEREGYLQQPHTSAGRVPTDKGYRFFVDNLTLPDLDQLESQQVREFFRAAHVELEQMLSDTSNLLSDLTSYAAVVVGPPHDVATIRSAQLVSLTDDLALLVVVHSNGVVEKHPVQLTTPVTNDQMDRASAAVSAALIGASLGTSVPTPVTGEAAVDEVVASAMGAVQSERSQSAPLYVGGASTVAAAFDAVDIVRKVLVTLEQQLVVVSLLSDVLDRGLSVAIGTETGVEPLSDCSIVVAPYHVDGEQAGSIGVLGPTRMNYQQALAAVAVVSKRLSHRLSEG
ncbi:MAG: heat-inducible transcriptional repressor HrcA [Actinomycetota bacterium]|nr:heat-inducible transcriptional repressor HrcA [Actinomycetota bacterium]